MLINRAYQEKLARISDFAIISTNIQQLTTMRKKRVANIMSLFNIMEVYPIKMDALAIPSLTNN